MEQLSTQERIALIKSITVNGGDFIGEDELAKLLGSGEKLYTYDGFEPSGQMHIAQGIVRAINVNKMTKAGFTFRMWVADWFGYLNNKMGGDLEKIKTVGRYFVEIWKASGMDLENTEFLWASDFANRGDYWALVMKVAKAVTLKRAIRTTQIMGRSESDDLSAGQILYPCMQVADIFGVMNARVTQLGLDQQKANLLAREVGEELGYWKPIIVSHGMVQGLQKPLDKKRTEFNVATLTTNTIFYKGIKISLEVEQVTPLVVSFKNEKGAELRRQVLELGANEKFFDIELKLREDGVVEVLENSPERQISMKMSKSKPETAIFMTDTVEEVEQKIRKAYCPEGIVEDNPILDYCKQIIFDAGYLLRETPLLENGKFVVSRPEKFGGDVSYETYEALESDFKEKKLFPLDLKNAVVGYLNRLLDPVRTHFETNAEAKELLAKVREYQATR
jgi:tyrosyl-tRNA synthetase